MQHMETIVHQSASGTQFPFRCESIGAEEFQFRSTHFGKCDVEVWKVKSGEGINKDTVSCAVMVGAFASRRMGRAYLSADVTEADGFVTVKLVFKPAGK